MCNFVFRPKAYFEQNQYAAITNPVLVGLMNNLDTPRYSPLILEGGDVIKAKDKIIVTDRVFKDNLYQVGSETEILIQLEKNFKIMLKYPDE